ncbi:MAG: DUF4177 domain-containing protein [Pseudomonadota bacterium]|nr:DUF4177 domain-containing protein [Pseudomonadota bacterium]
MSTRWSYKIVDMKATLLGLKAEAVQQTLNNLGAQGWELVNIQDVGFNLRLFLKRGE